MRVGGRRANLPFSSWDGRGSYDIIGCPNCSHGRWIKCSTTNNIIVNSFPLFRNSNKDIDERSVIY